MWRMCGWHVAGLRLDSGTWWARGRNVGRFMPAVWKAFGMGNVQLEYAKGHGWCMKGHMNGMCLASVVTHTN